MSPCRWTQLAITNDLVKLYDPFPADAYTGKLRAVYPLSPMRTVPAHIPRPDYADSPTGTFVRGASLSSRGLPWRAWVLVDCHAMPCL